MIRKLTLVFLCLLFCFCYALEIPKDRQVEYKNAVEFFASTQEPLSKKKIDKSFAEAQKINIQLQQAKTPTEKEYFREQLENKSAAIDSVVFWYYMSLLDITENFIKIKNTIPPCDYIAVVYDALQPCFTSAKADKNKINNIFFYGHKKASIVDSWENN